MGSGAWRSERRGSVVQVELQLHIVWVKSCWSLGWSRGDSGIDDRIEGDLDLGILCIAIYDNNVDCFEVLKQGVKVVEMETTAGVITALGMKG